jgi:hypothetical protein
MTRIKTMGLCLVAVFAMAAFATSFASAAPEFYGKAAIGSSVGNIAFTATSATAFLEGKTSKLKIQCTASSGGGKTSGATKTIENKTNFTSCEVAGAALPCESSGAAAKEIRTNNLVGDLGAISATLPGVKLTPESGPYLAEFGCAGGGVLIKVKGSLIGSITGASGNTVAEGKLPASTKLTFAQTGGLQKYTHFIGGTPEQLTSVVSEFSTEKGEYVTHEELSGQSVIATLKTTPAGNLGVTK